jgi:hypothetical protein
LASRPRLSSSSAILSCTPGTVAMLNNVQLVVWPEVQKQVHRTAGGGAYQDVAC